MAAVGVTLVVTEASVAPMWIQEFVDCIEGSTFGQPRFSQALAIKEQHLPKRIYKYRRDCDESRRNLGTDTVWLSSPDAYNDPYDCWFRFSKHDLSVALENRLVDTLVAQNNLQSLIPAEQIERAKGSPNPLRAIAGCIPDSINPAGTLKRRAELCSTQAQDLVRAASSTVQRWRNLTKLCSFSAISDSLLMWGHYADNHRGFCIEYHIDGLQADHPFREALYPVIYTNEIYDLTRWAKSLVSRDRGQFNTELLILCLIHKCAEWKYEQEWRKVLVTHTVEPDHDCAAPPHARVLLGSRMESANVRELRAICSSKKIEVWQMRVAEDRFELVPERLD